MKRLLILSLVLLVNLPAFAIDISNLKFGGQVRFREYDIRNMWTYDDEKKNDEWKMFRLKTSLSVSADLGDNISGMVKYTNQTYGEVVDKDGNMVYDDNIGNKVFVDNAYIDVKKFEDLPVNLRIGRQNLMYGSGFVLFDGQSQYASTSVYFDGLKLSVLAGEGNTLDLIYVKDQENLRDETNHDDITLYGFYLTMKKMLPCQAEVYFLNRLDEGKDKELMMLGARAADKLEMGLDYSVEGAFQMGSTDISGINNADHEAFGAKLDIGYSFKMDMKPRVFGQYAYLSGDDPKTKHYEGWDVYYGGWPQFGDLLAWSFLALPTGANVHNGNGNDNTKASTTAEAAYTNISITTLGVSLAPAEKISCKVSGSMIKWNEASDDDFGNYFQLSLGYKYSKSLSFAIYAAMIDPGDSFSNTEGDPSIELFYQADLRF